LLSRALARQPLVVDPGQFAESEPVIMRYRLNSRQPIGRNRFGSWTQANTMRRVMTPSNPWGDDRGQLSQRFQLRNQVLSRRQARRLSRRFARVGVNTPPQRLCQMLAGVPAAADEVTDVHFAFIATRLRREQLSAKFKRLKRRGARSLLFIGLVLVTLNFLFCMAYALFSLTLEAAPL
jgi:hypothetical protein